MIMNFIKHSFLTGFLLGFCMHLYGAEPVSSPASVINMTDYFKVFLGLVFVIALFLGSTFLFKRFGSASMTGQGQLRLVDGLHLGNKERLVLVELDNKQILLSITPGQVNKLDTINKPLLSKNSDV